MKWMLDTNTCIAIIRRRPEVALKRLSGKAVGQVGISSITLAELEFGAAKSQRSFLGFMHASVQHLIERVNMTGGTHEMNIAKTLMEVVR